MASRQLITFRVGAGGIAALDDLAARLTVERGGRKPITRTDVLRAALRIAFTDQAALAKTILALRAEDEARL